MAGIWEGVELPLSKFEDTHFMKAEIFLSAHPDAV